MFNHAALQCVFFFFHHLSSQFAVVVVSFDLTGCCVRRQGHCSGFSTGIAAFLSLLLVMFIS